MDVKQGMPQAYDNPTATGNMDGNYPKQTYPSDGATSQAYPPAYTPHDYNQVQPMNNFSSYSMPPQPQPGAPVVITTQPAFIVTTPQGPPPQDHMVFSCLVFWFCNMCIGAAAMYFSNESKGAALRGDMMTAQSRAKTAKQINIAGVIVGILIWIGVIVLTVLVWIPLINSVNDPWY